MIRWAYKSQSEQPPHVEVVVEADVHKRAPESRHDLLLEAVLPYTVYSPLEDHRLERESSGGGIVGRLVGNVREIPAFGCICVCGWLKRTMDSGKI